MLQERQRKLNAVQRYAERKRREATAAKQQEKDSSRKSKKADEPAVGSSPTEPTNAPVSMEELAHQIQARVDLIQALREELREEEQEGQHEVRNRKFAEAELFVGELQVMKIRTDAREAESKVQRLANELKACYQGLPGVLANRVVMPDVLLKNEELADAQTRSLRSAHNAFHFKFLDAAQLQQEEKLCEARMQHLRDFIRGGEEQARVNQRVFEHLLSRTLGDAQEMTTYLNLIWDKIRKEQDILSRMTGGFANTAPGGDDSDAAALETWLEQVPEAESALDRLNTRVAQVEEQLRSRLKKDTTSAQGQDAVGPPSLSPSQPPHEKLEQQHQAVGVLSVKAPVAHNH